MVKLDKAYYSLELESNTMGYISRILRVYSEEGVKPLIIKSMKYLYRNLVDFIERYIALLYSVCLDPFLPRITATYNGVKINASQYSRYRFPWTVNDKPHSESGLVNSLIENVNKGDTVVIIGGGWGVTTVTAAQRVGTSGHVIVYEGAKSEVEKLKDTIDINNVEDRVVINHAIVGEDINLRGKADGAATVAAGDLPDCDVLELDCEGAEVNILKKLKIRPRFILVESHGIFDASSRQLCKILKKVGYSIKSKEVASEGTRETCIDNDIHVITALRD